MKKGEKNEKNSKKSKKDRKRQKKTERDRKRQEMSEKVRKNERKTDVHVFHSSMTIKIPCGILYSSLFFVCQWHSMNALCDRNNTIKRLLNQVQL